MESGIHGFGIRNPANGIRNPSIVIQNPGCWNPLCCDGSRASSFPLATVAWKSHVARTRNRHVHACFTRRNIPCHCDISGINLKQWSHYNDVTESQGVIHITVYYRSFELFIRHPFDRAFRPFSPLRFWSRRFRFFSCLGAIGTNFWISGNVKRIII